jgi:hydrogenase expression/formation protein HypE
LDNDLILLGHGSGGKLSHQLLDELIIPKLSGVPVAGQNDAALLDIGGTRLAFSTDSYVVDPIFFPGGDIGDLAVNGTVNDLAMMGARPLCMSVALILEEGFSKSELARISGIGAVEHGLRIDGAAARTGDKVIVSGSIGDHGIAVLSAREGLEIDSGIVSDSAALKGLARKACRSTRRCRGSAQSWGWTRSTWQTRVNSLPLWHRSAPLKRWRSCAGIRKEKRPLSSAKSRKAPRVAY